MTVRFCVSILPETVVEAVNLVEKAEKRKADFIEVRLDRLKNYDALADIARHGRIPMIATNKSSDCKGEFSGSEIERQRTLFDAAKNGFEYVDLELSTPRLKSVVKNVRQTGAKLIISFHDFDETPSFAKISTILEEEAAVGADICKIVTTAKRIEDNLVILDFLSKTCGNHKTVSFCMGELGKPSRFLSPLFGAYFTIASLHPSGKTAPGQLPIQEMRKAYDALELT